MTKYNTFLLLFIASSIAMIVFLVFYLQAIFGLALNVDELERHHPNPFTLLATIFSPQVIISGAIMTFSSLAYRILGIVHVAKNKTAKEAEKALWIIGFIIMGFVTGIVFLVLARGRKLV